MISSNSGIQSEFDLQQRTRIPNLSAARQLDWLSSMNKHSSGIIESCPRAFK